MSRFASSACSTPKLNLDEALDLTVRTGFRQFEAFTSWAGSSLDLKADPTVYREAASKRGLSFSSMHLPPIQEGQFDETLEASIQAARFAESLGAPVVLFKAGDRPTYIRAAKPFLDATAGLQVTPVLQNHYGTPITTLDDFREVLDGIADSRMHTLLEVGHFHTAGVHWRQGAELLGDSIACVHIKDQIGSQSVPFGQGEIDLPGLFEYLDGREYRGGIVVEMEVADPENTERYLADAFTYLQNLCEENPS